MRDTSHQALSVEYRGARTTVEGINSRGERYSLEIDGPVAKRWHDVLRSNFYKRENQSPNEPPDDE